MSIAQRNEIEELRRHVLVLQERVDILYQVIAQLTGDKPRKTLTLNPWKKNAETH